MAATVPTTRAEAINYVLTTAGYRTAAGTATVEQRIVALEYLILHTPERAIHGGRGGEEIQTNVKLLQDLLEEATDFLEAQSTDQGVELLDFTEYRS